MAEHSVSSGLDLANNASDISIKFVMGSFPDSYMYNTRCDADGQVLERQLGSGYVKSLYSYYDWDEEGGRLAWMKAVDTYPTETTLQHLVYDYDAVGSITEIQDYKMR